MESRQVMPWERLAGEPTKAFQAFQQYRDMSASERSAAAVAAKCGRTLRLIERWCAGWNWVARTAAWDAERDRVAKLAELDGIAKAKQAEIVAIAEMRERHLQSVGGLLVLGRKELRKWLRKLEREPDTADPVLQPREIKLLIECAIKLERVIRGEPDSIQGQVSEATADERRRLMRPLLSHPEAANAIAKLNELALRSGDAGGE